MVLGAAPVIEPKSVPLSQWWALGSPPGFRRCGDEGGTEVSRPGVLPSRSPSAASGTQPSPKQTFFRPRRVRAQGPAQAGAPWETNFLPTPDFSSPLEKEPLASTHPVPFANVVCASSVKSADQPHFTDKEAKA